MEYFLSLATLAVTQLLGAMSPGQSFLVVSHTALASGRASALIVALGMGTGTVLWATAAITCLAVLFQQAAWLYLILKIAAGLYLVEASGRYREGIGRAAPGRGRPGQP